MKIVKVVATELNTQERQIFTFGTAADGKGIVATRGGKLKSYLDFCFEQTPECERDVEVELVVSGNTYLLSRLHGKDGKLTAVLKQRTADGEVVVSENPVKHLEDLLGLNLADLLARHYVNDKSVDDMHGDLKQFDEIRLLAEVQDSIEQSSQEVRQLKANALQRVREYASGATSNVEVSPASLGAVNAELDEVVRDLTIATAQLGEMRARQHSDVLLTDIARELEKAQTKYNKLLARQTDIDEARTRLKTREGVELLIPKVKTLQAIAEQRAQHDKKRYAITSELEWQEKELAGITQQLDEKDRQYALSQDKRNRIEAINNELAYIASLYEKNKKLNETLLELNDRQQQLTAEKTLYSNKLEQVEKSIAEVRQSLDAFHIPARSVGELLEAVRIDVKLDEVNAQIEKLQSELAVKESKIAEKESGLVVQVKRFRAVAELDVAVTPIKAKDTILQVLDTKYGKLESINQSLNEKQRNLERALEDYKYRIVQLEHSRSRLETDRDKALLRKQEEFKREVYLNSQKVYSDDASSVFAVTVNFHDQEIEALNQEIIARNLDRDLLLERAYQLEGALKEITRHIEINSAEMATLRREKENINRRYNEIVTQNSSEAVFNYLKALNSDNGTKYLLDVQQDAVRTESELYELKLAAESLRNKLTALKSRLKYLSETQQQLDDTRSSVDTLVTTNDKLKDELTDIGERLTSSYEQYKAISRQIESIESKLDDVRGALIETSKTIKVNEDQIAESTAKAQKYAGSEDIEHAVSNLRYDIGDIESERQMLKDSKQTLEKEIFKKRLEMEKTQWLYESKRREYDELYQELNFELGQKGLDIEKITAMDLDTSVDGLRKVIAEYDATRQSLADKIENLFAILQSQPTAVVTQAQIDDKEREIEQLITRQTELESRRKQQLSVYVAASAARAKVTVAAAEARTLSHLRDTLSHNEIMTLLIADKVKSMLKVATQYLKAFTGGNYKIVEDNYTVGVSMSEAIIPYDELTPEVKTATYVSVMLAVTNTDDADGKWLVFDEKLSIDKQALSEMLLNVDNISYVNNYVQDKH